MSKYGAVIQQNHQVVFVFSPEKRMGRAEQMKMRIERKETWNKNLLVLQKFTLWIPKRAAIHISPPLRAVRKNVYYIIINVLLLFVLYNLHETYTKKKKKITHKIMYM